MFKGWIKSGFGLAACGAAGLLATAFPVAAQKPLLAMLDQLEPGLWELRSREAGGGVERVCLRDARRLIQLRHPASSCDRVVVDDSAAEVAVQYTCRGQGYGLTRIRRETGRLLMGGADVSMLPSCEGIDHVNCRPTLDYERAVIPYDGCDVVTDLHGWPSSVCVPT